MLSFCFRFQGIDTCVCMYMDIYICKREGESERTSQVYVYMYVYTCVHVWVCACLRLEIARNRWLATRPVHRRGKLLYRCSEVCSMHFLF